MTAPRRQPGPRAQAPNTAGPNARTTSPGTPRASRLSALPSPNYSSQHAPPRHPSRMIPKRPFPAPPLGHVSPTRLEPRGPNWPLPFPAAPFPIGPPGHHVTKKSPEAAGGGRFLGYDTGKQRAGPFRLRGCVGSVAGAAGDGPDHGAAPGLAGSCCHERGCGGRGARRGSRRPLAAMGAACLGPPLRLLRAGRRPGRRSHEQGREAAPRVSGAGEDEAV